MMVIFWTGTAFFCMRRHQRVADLVIGHDALFSLGDDKALALGARDDGFH